MPNWMQIIMVFKTTFRNPEYRWYFKVVFTVFKRKKGRRLNYTQHLEIRGVLYLCRSSVGSLALWNQDHKWYVSVGSLIGLVAPLFLCCQTAMLSKHLLWNKVINAGPGWLQPVWATPQPHPASRTLLPLPILQPPPHRALPPYLTLTFIERGQGFSRCQGWVIIDTSYESVLWNCRRSPFSGRLYLVFFKWDWTELLNFCQLELFPPLLNHLKTTCFPRLFPSRWSFVF